MEKVQEKINELTEAVAAANGSVMVIGLMPGKAEDEKCVIAALRGNGGQVVEATAKLLTSGEAGAIAQILRNAMTIAALHKIAGGEKMTNEQITIKL